jgi:hypothetical protein
MNSFTSTQANANVNTDPFAQQSKENAAAFDNMQPSNMIDFCMCCGFMRTHSDSNVYYEDHYTCICLLLETATVCCVMGYSNMLDNIPSLALYTPIPQCTSDDYFKGLPMGVVITTRDEFLTNVHRCQQIKLQALLQAPNTRHAFLPIIFSEN